MRQYDRQEILEVLGRYDIVREYPYLRNPKAAAEHLSRKYAGKKLLFYGDGPHTFDILSGVCADVLIKGVIESIDKNSDFVAVDMPCPIYKMDQVAMEDYDFIVLVGYWRREAVSDFLDSHGLDGGRLIVVYREAEMQSLSRDMVEKELETSMRFESGKRRIALVLRGERRDYITACSEELSKYFSLTKVYLGSVANETNENFENVLVCNGEYSYVPILFEKYAFDMVIFFVCGQNDNGIGLFMQESLKNCTKFVSISCELSLDGYFDCDAQTLMDYYFNGDADIFELNRYAETRLMEASDGFISNVGGRYFDEVISMKSINPYFCKAFFSNNELAAPLQEHAYDVKNINIVYVGSMMLVNHRGLFSRYCDFSSVFEALLRENGSINMHCYNLHAASSIPGELLRLKEKKWFMHDRIPHSRIPYEISKMDFGFMWLNLDAELKRVLRKTFDSFFYAKFVSYVAAGLPVIVPRELTMLSSLVEEKRIGVAILSDELSALEGKLVNADYSQLRANMMAYRDEFRMQDHPFGLTKYLQNTMNREKVC